jgi:DHA1 family bicyclomycin/chloramphenicol resistance-like MFS transporter
VNTGITRSGAEFIALIALSMSLVALSIDSMLPALGSIAADLGARAPNDRQLVLTVFFAGLTVGLLVYGPISDSIGRKPTMYIGVALYILGGLLCAFAPNFTVMIAGRILQGFGAGSPRIVAIAMVRDLHGGRNMARIMSFVMAIFILVPILAPSIGQAILFVAPWRAIFLMLVGIGTIFLCWFAVRQPETHPPEARVEFSAAAIFSAGRQVLAHPITLGYMLATGLIFGAFISYLGTSQQIFQEQYGLGNLFPVFFGILAAGIGAASIVNARLVMRLGMRLLSKWALRASCSLSLGFLAIAWALGGHPPLSLFMAYMLVCFFCNGLLFSNYNALAMEPMGHIAGVAAAVTGAVATLVALVTGSLIGRAYDGTVIPLVAGFALLSLAALIVTEWAERKRTAIPPPSKPR